MSLALDVFLCHRLARGCVLRNEKVQDELDDWDVIKVFI